MAPLLPWVSQRSVSPWSLGNCHAFCAPRMKSNFLSLWLRADGFSAVVGPQRGYRFHRAFDAATELSRVRSDRDQRRTWDGTLIDLRSVLVPVTFPETYRERIEVRHRKMNSLSRQLDWLCWSRVPRAGRGEMRRTASPCEDP